MTPEGWGEGFYTKKSHHGRGMDISWIYQVLLYCHQNRVASGYGVKIYKQV